MSISRAFEKDPNYSPNWRSLIARHYSSEYFKAIACNPPETYLIPESEDDPLIRDYFSLLTVGDCNDDAIKYAHSTNESNNLRGFGSMMQAMLVGGLTVPEIAKEMYTQEENIQMYFKLFFDMERYLECEPLMATVITPINRSEEYLTPQRQTHMWLAIAYAFKWENAKYIINRNLDVDKKVIEIFNDAMATCINMQAAEFAMIIRSGGVARPSDIERYMSHLQATSIAASSMSESDSEKGKDFRSALFGLLTEKSKTLDDEHPLKQLIVEKTVQGTEIEQQPKEEQKRIVSLVPRHL